MRGLLFACLTALCLSATAATPARGVPPTKIALDADSLHAIAGWLRIHGRDGYLGADVADAMGIARGEGQELLAARQRGFRNDEVLRIAQLFEEHILFMVQQPDDRVYFYLSTPLGGLQKAFLSIPSKSTVVPLERAEAELRFQQELQYWKDRSTGN